ncbi:MAG: EVE domain-containing protein [Deltaproteobacteria bacterium]|nr:EVE domain-containing protein [Deltaproteobacteria bacterium]
MPIDIPNREDFLEAYARFQQDGSQQFRVDVRRNRSAFIREFMSREAIDPDEFNREVWIFESGTRVAGRDIKGQIPTTRPMSNELLPELKHAMASGTLELHGNYTWGTVSGVYSPSVRDKNVLRTNLQIARRILISAQPPLEKAKRLKLEVNGFGLNISTGLVMMFHPKEFAIYNQASQTATRLLGLPMDALETFQDSVRQLKEMLGSSDFLQLDWFLYLIREGDYPDALPFSRKVQIWRKDRCPTERISYRERKEREALRVLQGGTEALSREQLERALDLLNADFFRGKEYSKRFGLALTGNNRVNLLKNIARVNEWISRFLSAKASEVSNLISEFLEDHPPGTGIAFASLMLYLKNPQKYSIWLPAMIKGVNILTNAGFTERSGRAYLSYNDEVQRLRKIFDLAPQEPDILFSLDAESYLILSYKRESKWDDDPGKSYSYGSTVPNYKKVSEGSKFLLHEKGVGFIGHGVIGSIDREQGANGAPEAFRANFESYVPIDPPRPFDEELKAEVTALPGYNVQHAIKVVNKRVFDMVLERKRNAWIFQANPKIYDLENALKNLNVDRWSVAQHKEHIKKGDKVYFWQSGLNAGVLAVGQVLSDPKEMEDSPESMQFVKDPEKLTKIADRVEVKVNYVLPQILKREELKDHDILKNLTILKAPNATNFAVTPEQERTLYDLIEHSTSKKTWASIKGDLAFANLGADFAINSLYFENEDQIKARIRTALRTGKHIILIGPPGTGKSKLAKIICEHICGTQNYIMSTATSDWSTFETIGGYRPKPDGDLKFYPGLFLQCFQNAKHESINKLLIIDEINRADIDKAFGSLFSALTGDDITLPFDISDGQLKIIGNPKDSMKIKDFRFFIHPDWRIIATMNSYDKSSLYEMSYAFMRRFAFVPVDVPGKISPEMVKIFAAIWRLNADDDTCRNISELWTKTNEVRKIGPAIVEDILNCVIHSTPPDYTSAIIMFVMPQFEGLLEDEQKNFIDGVTRLPFVERGDEVKE